MHTKQRMTPANPSLALSLALSIPLFFSACTPSSPQAPVQPPTNTMAVKTPPPEFPLELACAGASGETLLGVTIGVEGTPTDVKLIRSSGHEPLDAAAIEAVKAWQFRPATRNGEPVPQTIQVPVNFRAPDVRPDACFALDEKR